MERMQLKKHCEDIYPHMKSIDKLKFFFEFLKFKNEVKKIYAKNAPSSRKMEINLINILSTINLTHMPLHQANTFE